MVMVLSIALWTLGPAQSAAEKFSAKTGVKAAAHVSGVVIGKSVRNERGVVLGTVENIVLNDSGCAQYVILSGKFSGARARLYPIPWTVIARTGPDAIFINLDPAFFTEAPSFEVNRWPDFSQTQWQTTIHNFYQKRSEMKAPGKGGSAQGKFGSEEKTKFERSHKAGQGKWEKPAAEGIVPPEQKAKGKERLEQERMHKPSDLGTQGAVDSSKRKQTDIKMKQQTEPKAGQSMQGAPGTMERGGTPMMERGRSHEEKSQQKVSPGHGVTPAAPDQTGEKVKKPGD